MLQLGLVVPFLGVQLALLCGVSLEMVWVGYGEGEQG